MGTNLLFNIKDSNFIACIKFYFIFEKKTARVEFYDPQAVTQV